MKTSGENAIMGWDADCVWAAPTSNQETFKGLFQKLPCVGACCIRGKKLEKP